MSKHEAFHILWEGTYPAVTMCTLDFIRKINEHSRLRKFLFKLICGKYAYREYELAEINLEVAYYYPDMGYGLEID